MSNLQRRTIRLGNPSAVKKIPPPFKTSLTPARSCYNRTRKIGGPPLTTTDKLRLSTFPLHSNAGHLPALGFGTLIPDPTTTYTATKTALATGFRALDTAERYRTETQVGQAIKEFLASSTTKREDLFLITKLWNTNHRPDRVQPAFEASLKKLQLDYLDLYLIHTPFAFLPGDNQEPKDPAGNVIYDNTTQLLDTWNALEKLVTQGKCKAIGLSDVTLEKTKEIVTHASIKPHVVHVESHPYLPEWDLLHYCQQNQIIFQAFAPLGHNSDPNLLADPIITRLATRLQITPAQVALAWAIQRGSACLTTSKTPTRIIENYNISTLPTDAIEEINKNITTQIRFNSVVHTGIPGFIPRQK